MTSQENQAGKFLGIVGACALSGMVIMSGCRSTPENHADTRRRPAHSGDAEKPAHDEEHADEQEGADEGGHHHERVQLSADQLSRFNIRVVAAEPGTIEHVLELPGEVRPNGDRLAHIVPRFPGIAKDIRKHVGDTARSGDLLAVIESSESLATYELRTLIDGTVIEKHITRGEAVDRERPTYVIADLSTVWVEISVYQQHLGGVHVGDQVRMSAGDGLAQGEGTISYITPGVDTATRTAVARVVLPNPDGVWRLGLFVNARILHPADVALAVPKGALQTFEGENVVFVATDEGFEPRPITLGRIGEDRVEVVSGLTAGERYAATNSFLLKAELGKASAEHEH